MKKKFKQHGMIRGFMLIEVLIALAIFGLSAVFLVDGAFVASRAAQQMKDTRELEQDLIWVRSEVLKTSDYDKFSEGGEINALSMGLVIWEADVEMTQVLDLYKVTLSLEYEGNTDYGIEGGVRQSSMYLLRPTWGNHPDFSTDRTRLLDERRRKMQEYQDEKKRGYR